MVLSAIACTRNDMVIRSAQKASPEVLTATKNWLRKLARHKIYSRGNKKNWRVTTAQVLALQGEWWLYVFTTRHFNIINQRMVSMHSILI